MKPQAEDYYKPDRETGMGTERFAFVLDGVRPGMSQQRVHRIMARNLRAWREERDHF